MLKHEVYSEKWPLRQPFVIARSRKDAASVVVLEVTDDGSTGRGEAVPSRRSGESVESIIAAIECALKQLTGYDDSTRTQLSHLLPPGAARNAVDCALWDLEAKVTGIPVWQRLGLPEVRPLATAVTLSLDTPDAMAREAREKASFPLLKLKLGGDGDVDRIQAVRAAAPSSRLIADANESWSEAIYLQQIDALANAGVEFLEQPFPAGADEALQYLPHLIPIYADESFRTHLDLQSISPLYDGINVKLDKAGGLTEALGSIEKARSFGLGVMVGCMVGTSLGIAPAHLAGQLCDLADLDSPLLLTTDRPNGISFPQNFASPPDRALWG